MRVSSPRHPFLSVDRGVPSVVQVDMDCSLLCVRVHSCMWNGECAPTIDVRQWLWNGECAPTSHATSEAVCSDVRPSVAWSVALPLAPLQWLRCAPQSDGEK